MKTSKIGLALVCLFSFYSCTPDTIETGELLLAPFIFEDGFETENNSIDDLFPSDQSRWSTIQQTNPSVGENSILLNDQLFSEGNQSLQIRSLKSDTLLSKIDIEKNGMILNKGDQINISADFYINSTESLENLLLIDLECCSCWDPTVGENMGAENQCPGVRLIMSGGNDFLSIERGKIAGNTLSQLNFSFPRMEWVSVEWKMSLSDVESGNNVLLINGIEVISEKGSNMPNAEVFRELFVAEGIDFHLQEPVFYERVQIGATANPTAGNIELYVDNFRIVVE